MAHLSSRRMVATALLAVVFSTPSALSQVPEARLGPVSVVAASTQNSPASTQNSPAPSQENVAPSQENVEPSQENVEQERRREAASSVEDPNPNPNAKTSRPCVLLKNENVLFGQATQVGEYVVVRSGEGGEIRLSRSEVACWADSLRNLYRFRVDQRQKGDLNAHLRDARWCLRFDLYDLVATELLSIRQLDPDSPQANSIESQLRRETSPRKTPSTPHQPGSALNVPPSTVSSLRGGFAQPGSGGADLTTLRIFASHVQPMLLNRCGTCHRSKSQNQEGWALIVPSSGSRASSKMTHQNMAATLPFVDTNSPRDSVLLTKATTPHGGGAAPLNMRNAKAIRSLEGWIRVASAAAARLEASGRSVDNRPRANHTSPPATVTQESTTPPEIPSTDADAFVAERPPMRLNPPPRQEETSGPQRLPQVTNPFDPALFNRRFHSNAEVSP